MIQSKGLRAHVVLPGFTKYLDLPVWYGLAGAFVHAASPEQWGLVVNEAMAAGLPVLVSNDCGCAPELVEPGRNGFVFDPRDTEGLAQHMFRMASGQYDRVAMGAASRDIIARWTPALFAENLWNAARTALSYLRPSRTFLDRAIIYGLGRL